MRPLPLLLAAALLVLASCRSINPKWEDISDEYAPGTIAQVSGGLGTALYRSSYSGQMPDSILRTGQEVTILEAGPDWSRVRSDEDGVGWVSTLELKPMPQG